MRNSSLDVLRALAVLLVIAFHANVVSFGWIGVDLFFVLSGFLISGLLFADLEENGRIRVGRFLLRRGFKIYPPFYAFLFATAILIPSNRNHLVPELLFLQNYRLLNPLISDTLSAWVHTWSLAVEEHFYFVLPIVLTLLARIKQLKLIPVLAGLLLMLCCTGRILSPHPASIPSVFVYPTHLRIDSLFAGVALGYFSRYYPERFKTITQSAWLLPLGLAFLFPAALSAHWFKSSVAPALILTSNIMGFGAVLAFAVNRALPYTHSLAEIGKYSYSIYLWHMPITLILNQSHHRSLSVALAFILSCAIGIAMALLIEFPVLRVREKIVPDG
jgi:peptidoglycan/LPS O-acetylase OafA/YrhL